MGSSRSANLVAQTQVLWWNHRLLLDLTSRPKKAECSRAFRMVDQEEVGVDMCLLPKPHPSHTLFIVSNRECREIIHSPVAESSVGTEGFDAPGGLGGMANKLAADGFGASSSMSQSSASASSSSSSSLSASGSLPSWGSTPRSPMS